MAFYLWALTPVCGVVGLGEFCPSSQCVVGHLLPWYLGVATPDEAGPLQYRQAANPSWVSTLDIQNSTFCSLLPGHNEGQGSGWAAKGTMQGWTRRARESPMQESETHRTQLSQDLGGGTLAIDTLPDNKTRVLVSSEHCGVGGESFEAGPGGQSGEGCQGKMWRWGPDGAVKS